MSASSVFAPTPSADAATDPPMHIPLRAADVSTTAAVATAASFSAALSAASTTAAAYTTADAVPSSFSMSSSSASSPSAFSSSSSIRSCKPPRSTAVVKKARVDPVDAALQHIFAFLPLPVLARSVLPTCRAWRSSALALTSSPQSPLKACTFTVNPSCAAPSAASSNAVATAVSLGAPPSTVQTSWGPAHFDSLCRAPIRHCIASLRLDAFALSTTQLLHLSASLSQLTALRIQLCRQQWEASHSPAAIETLVAGAFRTSLRSLWLTVAGQAATTLAVSTLPAAISLQKLTLSAPDAGDFDLRSLSRCPSLTELCCHFPLTSAHFDVIKQLVRLRSLDLGPAGSQVCASTLEQLYSSPQQLKALEQIDLSALILDDAAMRALLPVSSTLRVLNPRCIRPSVYMQLHHFMHLERLTINMQLDSPACAADAEQLVHAFRALPSLRELTLQHWNDFSFRGATSADLPPVAVSLTHVLRSVPYLQRLTLANVDCRGLVAVLLSDEGPHHLEQLSLQFSSAHCQAPQSRQLGPSPADFVQLGLLKSLHTLVAHYATPLDAARLKMIRRGCVLNHARGASQSSGATISTLSSAEEQSSFPALRYFDWCWNQQRIVAGQRETPSQAL